MHYYYYDLSNNIQGPYSESAYKKWFANGDMPPGTKLYDQNNKPVLIENIAGNSFKARTKVLFSDETMFLDKTIDLTNLDVTLDLDLTDRPIDNSSFFDQDFSQIDEGVDEATFGKSSEQDTQRVHILKMVNIYIGRRALHNRRRFIPDDYVPFEYPWHSWVPQPMKVAEALRWAVQITSVLQKYDPAVFSQYLKSLNIFPHSCYLCYLDFSNSHEMLSHFVGVPHVNRVYSQNPGKHLSFIDVYCIQKIVSEVGECCETGNFEYFTTGNCPIAPEMCFFDSVDITTAFESLKSTVTLMQTTPLLKPPLPGFEGNATCEYIEILLYLRRFENAYNSIDKNQRGRRLGLIGETFCSYCNIKINGVFFDSIPKHVVSEDHVRNTLHKGARRLEMEYWISFLRALVDGKRNTRNDWRHRQSVGISLQEADIPFCNNLVQLVNGDFVYTEREAVQVMNFVRNEVRESFPLLDDREFITNCHWCQVDLFTQQSALCHILYDKCHLSHLNVISNDDLRRFFRLLNIPITIPLFRTAKVTMASRMSAFFMAEKEMTLQRLQNVAYRSLKRRMISYLASKSFPMGLVNRCDLCDESIEQLDDILEHFCSKRHQKILLTDPGISKADIDCWFAIFCVGGRYPKQRN